MLLGVFAIKNSSLISSFILSTVLISSCSLLPKIPSVNGIEESAPLLDATPASLIDVLSEEHLPPTDHQVTEELLSTPEEPVAASEPEDLWKRIRSGYQLDLNNLPDAVTKQRQWYINNPSYLKAVFSRAEPFIYYITDQLEQAGLPLELALLPIVESTYDPLAYSPSHAAGLWQFIPSTAKQFGLERNRWYDGRRDVVSSTKAAIKYLSYLNNRFDNDWLLALAAYNSGEGYVSKSMRKNRKAGKPEDFWSIRLPKETRNYVPQLLALASLIEKPSAHQIELPFIANSPYFEIIEIEHQVELQKVMEVSGVNKTLFHRLNSGFRRSTTPPTGQHTLLFPLENANSFRVSLQTTSQKDWIPHTEYEVIAGDTLSQIAEQFDTPLSWIKARNHLNSSLLKIGQILLIPHDEGTMATTSAASRFKNTSYRVVSGDSLSSIALRYKTSVKSLQRQNALSSDRIKIDQYLNIRIADNQSVDENLRRLSYKVRTGDSLYLIAAKFDLDIRDITSWNNISPDNYLQPGQKLTLFVNRLRI